MILGMMLGVFSWDWQLQVLLQRDILTVYCCMTQYIAISLFYIRGFCLRYDLQCPVYSDRHANPVVQNVFSACFLLAIVVQ